MSNIGTWMEAVALSYYVADTTGKASWAAVVGAASFLPGAVLGPVGAAMSDRLDRRRMLVGTYATSAAIAAVLAIWVGGGTATPAGIAMLTFVAGSVSAFGFPAWSTTLPTVVPREHIVAAVGLSNAQWNLGRVLGPVAAAVAIHVGGIGTALWINAASFGATILGVLLVRVRPNRGERRPVFGALADGIRFARTNPSMRRMVPLMMLTVGIGSPFIAFVAQMATAEHHGDSTTTAILVGSQGVGAVIAAFSLGAVTARFGSRRVMLTGITALGLALVAYAAAQPLWLAAIGIALVGMSYGTAFTSFGGVAQLAAPDAMRGRVLAVNAFILGAFYPVGALVQGVLADPLGLRWVTAGSGVLLLVSAAVWQWYLRTRAVRAAAATSEPPSVVQPRHRGSPANR